MKAKLFAAVLSLFFIEHFAHAETPKESTIPRPAPLVNHKIDLNQADLATLTGSMKGIGKKRAEAIIAYRNSHNGFKSLQELADVKGFSNHFLSVNKDKLNEVFIINKPK